MDRIVVRSPTGKVVGVANARRLTLFDRELKAHLEEVMASGLPIGPDGGLARPSVFALLDYLGRSGYEVVWPKGKVEKAPGISEDGSESADPGHVVGDGSPELEKDFGGAGAPMTGGMVSTPVAGSGRKRPGWSRGLRRGR
jgi:hypothetical protein